jgi:hypothetical protein
MNKTSFTSATGTPGRKCALLAITRHHHGPERVKRPRRSDVCRHARGAVRKFRIDRDGDHREVGAHPGGILGLVPRHQCGQRVHQNAERRAAIAERAAEWLDCPARLSI